MQNPPRIAILGAGISGLTCARTLRDSGMQVHVFEKSRGVGGRMATRRTGSGLRFDHGAQYFTVRDQRFQKQVDEYVQAGLVGRWHGRVGALSNGELTWPDEPTPRYVGIPAMNSICSHLASDLTIDLETQLEPPERINGLWKLSTVDGRELGTFDYFATSAPAPQSAEILSNAAELAQTIRAVPMNPCWAVMLGLANSLDLSFDAAFVHDSPLSWIARNDSKPHRDRETECWVLHASSQWSGEHLEAEPEAVSARLLEAFWQATGVTGNNAVHLTSHRWRYALPPNPLEQACLFEAGTGAGACGDWCGGPRVEGAFVSGLALADRIIRATRV